MLRPGDHVAVVDEDLEGQVISIDKNNEVAVETAEGFVLRFPEKDLVRTGKLGNILPDDPEDLSQVIRQKEEPRKPRSRRTRPKDRNLPPMEVDLHIGKLVPRSGGMSNYEILSVQLDAAKGQLEFAIRKRIQKVVFIHGVGEGVLRAELETLVSRYDNLTFYDADYQKYGLGATEVYIYQNS